MFDINTITSFAIDIAGSGASRAKQEELAEVVWSLLENDYRIFLFSSNDEEDLRREDFPHSRLSFLPHPMPPGEVLAREIPGLAAPETLWVTEAPPLQEWLNRQNQKLAHAKGGKGFGDRGLRIGSLRDLSILFEPIARVLHEVSDEIARRLGKRESGATLVGVGGPPMSGFQRFAVNLRTQLQSTGFPLVDLLDLSPFIPGGSTAPAPEAESWTETPAGAWLLREVLSPLKAGRPVFIESLPPEVPADFEAHLPLFLSEKSLVLVLGERVFVPPVSETLVMRILLEVSPRETARRMYEIPEAQPFEDKFVAQYLAREGANYKRYLEAFPVAETATIRLSAEKENRLSIERIAAG